MFHAALWIYLSRQFKIAIDLYPSATMDGQE